MKKLLLFDIDGTLLRSEGATFKSITQTFQELFGVKDTINILSLIGATDCGIFKDAAKKLLGRQLSGKEMKAVQKRYLELLPEDLVAARFELKPGVAKLLEMLSSRKDIILGLETGNLEAGAFLKLKRGDIDKYFTVGGFGSDSENRTDLIRKAIERANKLNGRPIKPENIFVIGDAPHDIRAGREAGAITIAVGTGLLTKEEVMAAKPDYFLEDLSDIPVFLKLIGCEK